MKRRSRPKLKGTVLFTVISVMSLLIIFLTSTLVLATSASNRAHKNYASSQTEYTARAAIDSFAEAMARNDGVAQMIVNMNKTDVLTPSVKINDSSLGRIGYYDASGNWQEDKITIEYIDDTYVFNEKKNKWEEQQIIKVNATALLGGEESTVAAYIRKKSPDEPKVTDVKGFKTSGGMAPDATEGFYSGELAMGLIDTVKQTYSLKNGTRIDTDSTFVNGNLSVSGNDIKIDVSEKNTNTIIMGNLNIQNNFEINTDYDLTTNDFVQKDIPYLYVDGTITGKIDVKSSINQLPYNIFCNSFNTVDKAMSLDGADLYLMDAGANSSITVNSTKLSSWTASLAQRGDTQFNSTGGNIYSKGNLELANTTVNGDVRVEGDVTIGSSVNITGNLVVGGTLNINAPFTVGGKIYATNYNGFTPTLKAGYTVSTLNNIKHEATVSIDPQYKKVNNIHYDYDSANYEIYDSEQPGDGGWGWIDRNGDVRNSKVTYYDNAGNCYEENQWYQYNFNGANISFQMNADEISRGYRFDIFGNIYHYDQYAPDKYDSGYYAKADSDGNLMLNVDGKPAEKTDKEYYYWDTVNNVEVDEASITVITPEYYTKVAFDGSDTYEVTTELTSIFYYKPDGTLTTESDAYTGVHPASDYIAVNGSIYPSNMTKEAITAINPDGTPAIDTKNKIVTSLQEMHEKIGYTGSFDSSVYYTAVPGGTDSFEKVKAEGVMVIDKNTILQGGGDTSGRNLDITIKPGKNTVWVVLDNLSVGDRDHHIYIDDSQGGTVNFFVNGAFNVNKMKIETSQVYDGCTIDENTKVNVNWYGEVGSSINSTNNITFVGTARMPYSTLNVPVSSGKYSVNYKDESGSVSSDSYSWIGSGLFGGAKTNNNFKIRDVENGSSADPVIFNNTLDESWTIMYYDVY